MPFFKINYSFTNYFLKLQSSTDRNLKLKLSAGYLLSEDILIYCHSMNFKHNTTWQNIVLNFLSTVQPNCSHSNDEGIK